jgi:hypothetical protein
MKIIPYKSYVIHCSKSSSEVEGVINGACASVSSSVRVLKFDLELKPLVGFFIKINFLFIEILVIEINFYP